MEFHNNKLRYNHKGKFHEPEKTFDRRTKGFNIRELFYNQVPLSELAEKYHVHINLIHSWKKQLFEGAASLLNNNAGRKKNSPSSAELKKIASIEEKLKKHNQKL